MDGGWVGERSSVMEEVVWEMERGGGGYWVGDGGGWMVGECGFKKNQKRIERPSNFFFPASSKPNGIFFSQRGRGPGEKNLLNDSGFEFEKPQPKKKKISSTLHPSPMHTSPHRSPRIPTKVTRAGIPHPLFFSARDMQRQMRILTKGVCVGEDAAVYLAGALEHVARTMLEIAGNIARRDNRTSIKPRHLQLAVRNDEELYKLLGNITHEPPPPGSPLRNNVYAVLKQVYPDTGISRKAIEFVCGLLVPLRQRLIGSAASLVARDAMMTSNEVQTSLRLTFPGELAKHAVSAGTRALSLHSTIETAESKLDHAGKQLDQLDAACLAILSGKKI